MLRVNSASSRAQRNRGALCSRVFMFHSTGCQDLSNYTEILPLDNGLVTVLNFLRGTHHLAGLDARTNFKFLVGTIICKWHFGNLP